MINHDYTLLLNTADISNMSSKTWYIPRNFTSVHIPAKIKYLDNIFFPCATKDERNYYAMCYIDILHSL